MTRLFLVALTIFATVARSQSPAPPTPDARKLRLGTDSLEIYLVRQGERRRTGYVVDRLDTVRVNGEPRLRRVYRTVDRVFGNGIDTIVDRFPDLRPRSVASVSSLGAAEMVTWQDGRVVGTVTTANHPSRAIDTTVSSTTFSGATFDLILRASPLAVGYRVEVPSFSGRQGATMLEARVVGEESLPGLGETWRVEADFGGLAVTFWIDKTTRRLVQQSMTVAPGTEIVFLAPRGAST